MPAKDLRPARPGSRRAGRSSPDRGILAFHPFRRHPSCPGARRLAPAPLPDRLVEDGGGGGGEVERLDAAAHRQADPAIAGLAGEASQAVLLAADADHHLAGEVDLPRRVAARLERVDPVAVLLAPDGAVIAESDDTDGDLNPRFTVQLPADGTYRVRVNGYNVAGRFTLTVEALVP